MDERLFERGAPWWEVGTSLDAAEGSESGGRRTEWLRDVAARHGRSYSLLVRMLATWRGLAQVADAAGRPVGHFRALPFSAAEELVRASRLARLGRLPADEVGRWARLLLDGNSPADLRALQQALRRLSGEHAVDARSSGYLAEQAVAARPELLLAPEHLAPYRGRPMRVRLHQRVRASLVVDVMLEAVERLPDGRPAFVVAAEIRALTTRDTGKIFTGLVDRCARLEAMRRAAIVDAWVLAVVVSGEGVEPSHLLQGRLISALDDLGLPHGLVVYDLSDLINKK